MKRNRLAIFTAFSALGIAAISGPSAAAPACDDACLTHYADTYLNALAARDPSRAPLAHDVRFTENTVALKPGDALWRTITALGRYRLFATDPETGEIAGFATIRENDVPEILMLRLKVRAGQIHEVETLVDRTEAGDGAGPMRLDNMSAPDPVWLQRLAPDDRPTREQLIRTANRYFDGILLSSGDVVPFDPDCARVLDGKPDTNAGAQKGDDPSHFKSGGKFRPGSLGCRANMNTKMFAYIASVDPRRYLVADTEHGIVIGIFMFNHTGAIRKVDVPGVGLVDVPKKYQKPDSTYVAEMFKIRKGLILRVEGVRNALPYGARTGWEKPWVSASDPPTVPKPMAQAEIDALMNPQVTPALDLR